MVSGAKKSDQMKRLRILSSLLAADDVFGVAESWLPQPAMKHVATQSIVIANGFARRIAYDPR